MAATFVQAQKSKLSSLFCALNADVFAEVKPPWYQTHYRVRFKNTKHTVEGTDLASVHKAAWDYRNAYFNLMGEEP
jgi:hypothetical protein